MKDYNKYQWSKFVGSNRSEQIVVRGDTWEEITEGINAVQEYVDLVEATQTDPSDKFKSFDSGAPDVATKCEKCGSNMEYKTGQSKAGKPWKGWFCASGEKGHPVKWG